jgi:NADH-quinone oxidoreductase subunit J
VTPNLFVFALLATLTVLFALGVVVFANPVRSALCLVATFFLLAVLFFTLRAEILGITQLVVYAGAIMVLFLFVIMLLSVGATEKIEEKFEVRKAVGGVVGLALALLIGAQVLAPMAHASNDPMTPEGFGGPHGIGMALFTDYGYAFEAVSVLLMIGVVGSILLAKRRVQ